MRSVGIIPCDNGLGHIIRSVDLSNYLIRKFNIILYLKKKQKLNIKKNILVNRINSNFKLLNKSLYDKNWYKRINQKNLKNIDLLISDNLPEAVLLNKKTIIFANFFWHEIFNLKNKFFKDLENKLCENKIKVLSNYMFGSIKSSKIKIIKIGFIGKFLNENKSKANGILISLGTSKIGYKKNLNILSKIINNRSYKNYQFYVDKNLIRNKRSLPKNIKIANFSNQMFKKIKIALIKPGFSTIQDCLRRGIPIVSYLGNYNEEFLNNAKILRKNKIGKYFFNFDAALKEIFLRLDNKMDIIKTKNICKKLRWKGEVNFQKEIKRLINVKTSYLYTNRNNS